MSNYPANFVARTRNMPKQYNCCVPTCQYRGVYSSFLNFPKDPSIRRQWITAIPNLDCVVHHKFLICKNHFNDGEVTCNGSTLTVASDAIPSVFNQCLDNNEVKKTYFPNFMFEMAERDIGPQTLQHLTTEDFIVDFFYLRNTYKEKLGKFMINWNVSFTTNYAFFYYLSLDHIAKVKCSVKIDEHLFVQVVLSGRIMDPLDLTWILPATTKITRWSQLRMLLFEFGVPIDTQVNEVVSDLFQTPNPF